MLLSLLPQLHTREQILLPNPLVIGTRYVMICLLEIIHQIQTFFFHTYILFGELLKNGFKYALVVVPTMTSLLHIQFIILETPSRLEWPSPFETVGFPSYFSRFSPLKLFFIFRDNKMIELKAAGPSELPRFHKDFIGIGHELQRKRRDRRKVALEERSIVNRVLYLEKQEVRTRKTLDKKQQLVSKMVETADRQHNEMQQKQQLRSEREEELERLKNENRFRRILHLEAKQHTIEHIQTSKMQDYSRIKKIEELGELSKINFKLRDLDQKRRKAMTIMEGHNRGRSKVDRYFKKQNKQHASAYKERISLEENTVNAKMSTIKQLQKIETVLRQRVEQGSAKVSQVDQLLLDVSRSIDRQRSSRVSIAKSHRQSAPFRSRSQLETMENELIVENAQPVTERKKEEEVEEDIQPEEEEDGTRGKAFVRKRNRNKHKNRYRQYELF